MKWYFASDDFPDFPFLGTYQPQTDFKLSVFQQKLLAKFKFVEFK